MALESNENKADNAEQQPKRRKRRWGEVATTTIAPPPAPASVSTAPDDTAARILAMKASISARLAAVKSKQAEIVPKPEKRAKHFDLDLSTTGRLPPSTAAPALPPPAKKINPYLAHRHEDHEDNLEVEVDDRLLRASKPRSRHKDLRFVEPGQWQEVAERKRQKAAEAEQAGYVSGRKSGHTIHAAGMGGIYGPSEDIEDEADILAPRADARTDTHMPVIFEWWDMDLLPSKLRKQVATIESDALTKSTKRFSLKKLDVADDTKDDAEIESTIDELRNRCFEKASLANSKTASLVQHIVPIKPPSYKPELAKKPTLHLTKKELKRQRKLRRQEKQRELQDMQAAGLIPAPEPRLTLKNFIQVLGDQAFVDPSKVEQKVQEQMQARQRAHLERNEAAKLTKEQRAMKQARKLQEDTSAGVAVALFYVKDMSHPYHRAKVELNAQQSNITGGVLECENPQLACVICEGGPKAIKRFIRLMTVRMKWTGPEETDDEGESNDEGEEEGLKHRFNSDNRCELVWQGMSVKRFFKGFVFQACETSDQARRVLKGKGVGKYWDQALEHMNGNTGGLQLKLEYDASDDNPYAQDSGEEMEVDDA